MKKTLYRMGGCTAAALGFAGAFLPVLPTTPFLLVAVYCFSRSSPKLHLWLLSNKHYGEYLKNYEKERSVPMFVKITAISTMSAMIAFTAIIFMDKIWLKFMLFAVALSVAAHIMSLKTSRHE